MPFFSVIIPVYNKGPHIRRSISSVLNQTFQDFEVIVVNDASTDNSLEEILKFHDPRIRLLHRDTPGPGGYAARNLGIREAKAEWAAFLDADDEWNIEFLAKMRNLMLEFPQAQVLSSGWWLVEETGKKSADDYYDRNKTSGNHIYNLKTYLSGPRPICMSVAVVKKKLLLRINGFDEKWNHGADTELWLRLMLNSTIGAWCPMIGAVYYQDAVNRVGRSLTQELSLSVKSIQTFLKKNPHHHLRRKLRQYANRQAIPPALRCAIQNHMTLKYIKDNFYFERNAISKLMFCFVVLAIDIIPRFIKKKLLAHLTRIQHTF